MVLELVGSIVGLSASPRFRPIGSGWSV